METILQLCLPFETKLSSAEKARIRERRRYKKDREKRLAACKAYRDTHKEQRKAYDGRRYEADKQNHNIKTRQYYEANKTKIIAKQTVKRREQRNTDGGRLKKQEREYRLQNSSRINEWRKEWRKQNKDFIRDGTNVYKARHKAKKLGLTEHLTLEDWREILESIERKCLCCGEALPLSVDHIVPFSIGGSNRVDNVQPLCVSCNSEKGTKIIDYRSKFLRMKFK